jgi:hypothetical protein
MMRGVGIALTCALLVGVWLLGARTLHSAYFITGWALVVVLGVELTRRWWGARRSISARLGGQVALGLGTALLFGVHVEFRAPNGVLDCLLAALFGLLLLSGVAGLLLGIGLHRGVLEDSGSRFANRWLMLHVPLTTSLLVLGVAHGILAHAHGLLAHLMLGK